MSNRIRSRVYVLGDNIDTDQIIPAEFLNLVPTLPAEYRALGSHAMAGRPESLPPFVRPEAQQSDYGLIVAGRNFGCGSSREHAPIALGAAGCRAVIARSYARIFFRNAVSTGELYPFESQDDLTARFQTGDEAELDLEAGTLTRCACGTVFALAPLGAVAPVVAAGGLFQYARQVGMIQSAPTRPEGRGE